MNGAETNRESEILLSVVAAAFNGNELAHTRFDDCKVSIWNYSNPEHFNSLWKSLESDNLKKATRVLIIWNTTPSDESLFPVNTFDHVSPLHWAACAAKAPSQIQVCILDLNPSAHRGQYLYEHYLTCDKNRLPWLRVVQAAHLFGIENAQGEFEADALPVEIKGLFARLFPELKTKKTSIEASQFIDRIRNELTSPQNAENRHAISNIIGPMILRSGRRLPTHTSGIRFIKNGKQTEFPTAAQSDASHRWALNAILRAARLMAADFVDDQADEQALEASAGWLAVDEECKKAGILPAELRITLVDDQWTQGWLAWIKEGLGTTLVELQVSPDPDFLLHLLREVGCERRPFSLSLSAMASGQDHSKQDVLLLDLRLFTNSATAEKKFATELRDMLGVAAKGQNASEGQRFRGDLAVVERRLQMLSGADVRLSSEEHARYVTILPRLIASSDFSLPIIVFSSSGQREVLVEPFEKYPSIITTFSKPRHFQGENDNVVVNSEATLGEAFVRAIRWVRGRKLVQQIQSRSLAQLEKARKRCAGHTHFELYFDESGKSAFPNFRCAALLIGYRDGGQAEPFDEDSKRVHRQIEKAGINLWHEDNARLQGSYGRDPSEQWEAYAQGLTEILGQRPLIPFVISRTPSTRDVCNDLDLAHPDAMDNALFDLLELILEITLIEVLPAVSDNPGSLTLSIYGACRLQTLDLEASDETAALKEAADKWQLLKFRYGLQKDEAWLQDEQWLRQRTKLEKGKWCFLYRSLRADSFLPMLARCMGNRASSAFAESLRLNIKTVIGVQLPKKQRPTKEVRHQHYICDRLAYFSQIPHHNPESIDLGLLKNWPPIQESCLGFLGRRSISLLRLVECGRQLDVENIPLAIALGQELLICDGIYAEALASRVQAKIPKLSAESFNELQELIGNILESNQFTALPADKFHSKRKIKLHQMQSSRRDEFRGKKREKAFSQPQANPKSSQLPTSALRQLEEAMDRPAMPSQREAQSEPFSGVGSTSRKSGTDNTPELLVKHIDTGASDHEIAHEIEVAVKTTANVEVKAKVLRNKTSGIPYAFVKFRNADEMNDVCKKTGGTIVLFGRMFSIEPAK